MCIHWDDVCTVYGIWFILIVRHDIHYMLIILDDILYIYVYMYSWYASAYAHMMHDVYNMICNLFHVMHDIHDKKTMYDIWYMFSLSYKCDTYMRWYWYGIDVRFLQGSLSFSLELVGCLGDAEILPVTTGVSFQLSWILLRGKAAKRSWRRAWSSSVASKDSTAPSCLGCGCILTCGARAVVTEAASMMVVWQIFNGFLW